MNEQAIAGFLTEQKVKGATRRTWGVGTVIAKATSRAVQATMSSLRMSDQIITSKNREVAIRLVGEVLSSNALEIMDPSRFSAETTTFCALLGQRLPYGADQVCLVFITIRALSDETSQILLEAYGKGWLQAQVSNDMKRLKRAITDRLA